jgi:hypothetical protein
MTKDELTAWALGNGWQMVADHPSLTRPTPPHEAIVRLVCKATLAALEIKKPSGKWEKVAGETYAKIMADPETGMPGGIGLSTITGITKLMQDNRDRMVFAKFKGA